jgi:hypothetical protein
MSIETVIEGEVKAVETKVETVAAAVVAKVEEKVKAALVQISTEEKLALRELELEYLKAQTQIQQLAKITEEKSKGYQTLVESLFTKYLVTKAEYVFDGAVNAFKKL